ncbi:DNA polymerase III subunit gamma/tau [candidate division KSB1 bacterium]|nr:DNA polymerase III subunit gamma/tau [candidate division KSB1 bacterium]
MSYLVLARKYRPMFFQDVMGQQHVTKTLENAIRQQRIANAYLFSGPRGVGKTTVARLLSKALNCDSGPTIQPCNTCTSCVEINESRSLDVFEIDGASNRGIDEVRNLRESLKYSPNPGKYRIYIIDEVHMLTNEAFNALLKTLEEPPPRVLFIFATTEAHKVPATILSRTQRFDFKRISNKVIIEQLNVLCEKENIQIDQESLRLIAEKADGSMRDAESILDQMIAFAGTDIRSSDVMSLLGIIDSSLFFQITDLVRAEDVQGGVELANRIFLEGYDFADFLSGLAQHYRNLLVAKMTKSTGSLDVGDAQAKRYLQECENFSTEKLLNLLKAASDAEFLVRKSSNARLHLEVALIKMINPEDIKIPSDDALKKKHSPPDNSASQKIRPVNSPTDTEPSSTGSLPEPPPLPEFETGPVLSSPQQPDTIPAPSRNNSPHVSAPPSHPEKSDHDVPELPDFQLPKFEPVQDGGEFGLSDMQKHWANVIEYIKKEKIALGSFLEESWPSQLDGSVLHLGFGPQNGFHMASVERNSSFVEQALKELFGVTWRVVCRKNDTKQTNEKNQEKKPLDKRLEFQLLARENETVKMIVDEFDAEFIR